jgi:hypothetical protein
VWFLRTLRREQQQAVTAISRPKQYSIVELTISTFLGWLCWLWWWPSSSSSFCVSKICVTRCPCCSFMSAAGGGDSGWKIIYVRPRSHSRDNETLVKTWSLFTMHKYGDKLTEDCRNCMRSFISCTAQLHVTRAVKSGQGERNGWATLFVRFFRQETSCTLRKPRFISAVTRATTCPTSEPHQPSPQFNIQCNIIFQSMTRST